MWKISTLVRTKKYDRKFARNLHRKEFGNKGIGAQWKFTMKSNEEVGKRNGR